MNAYLFLFFAYTPFSITIGLLLLMRACAKYDTLYFCIILITYKTQRDASTICVDGLAGKNLTQRESNNKTMPWSHQIHDTRFEQAGVDSNNDATFLTKDYSVVSQNKSMSFDETSRLALLSIPPLEEEGGKDGADERTTEVVLSFGSVGLRWNHSHYWKRREGKLKASLNSYIQIYI